MIYYTFCDELWRYHYTFCKELYDSPTHTVISPSRIALLCTSSAGGLLTPLLTNSLILHSIIISFRPAWLARDTALASSVHSLQEMTDADEGRKTPFEA